MGAMTERAAKIRLKHINGKDYPDQPYTRISTFVEDVAALAETYPQDMAKTIGKSHTTVLSSLEHALRPVGLEYLLNGARFIGRNPDIPVMYGTTRNEAFHMQLKSFWRNVMWQTSRNAKVVASLVTFAKLMVGQIQSTCYTTNKPEHELLRRAAAILMSDPLTFEPLMDLSAVPTPKADLASLPPNAKVPWKRPAQSQRTTSNGVAKRPCMRI